MKNTDFLFIIVCLLSASVLRAQGGRVVHPLNGGWSFARDTASAAWQPVSLPHTWNAEDVLDDVPGYERARCWYRRELDFDPAWSGKEVGLYFEGANQRTQVLVNGQVAGRHTGGYTGFYIPLSPLLKPGRNVLLVSVDNRHDSLVAPLSADFSFYGGIYRDVHLMVTAPVRFATGDHGGPGVQLTTPFVDSSQATVRMKALLQNNSGRQATLVLAARIIAPNGSRIMEKQKQITIPAGRTLAGQVQFDTIRKPLLWSPEHPNRYRVELSLYDASGKLLDRLDQPLGFRWFHFDAAKGFYLNGRPYRIAGASRHQDYKGLGNALPDSLAVRDLVLLKNMGANFVRVAHYPQDPSVLAACDSLGLLASVEIPVVNEITEGEGFAQNARTMLVEMIRQGHNHPSVIIWCYMNEVLLKPHFTTDKPRQQRYYRNVAALARSLDSLARAEDPARYTMIANHGDLQKYASVGLVQIPMLVGWNLYSGWYGSSIDEFGHTLDAIHRQFPQQPFLVSEYGADADPRIRSLRPIRFDKSLEYTTAFHQRYLLEMDKRPFVAGAVVWNLADFSSETRSESMPHINNKGLLGWDRKPKDAYHFYQARWSKQPMIRILGGDEPRLAIADSNETYCYYPIQLASNLDSIELQANGQTVGRKAVVNGLCTFKVPVRDGMNQLKASGTQAGMRYTDSVALRFDLQPYCLRQESLPFRQLNVLLGAQRYFSDSKGLLWQPDQPYAKGRWGSIGGRSFRMEGNNRLPYGTDRNILQTDDDPIYQTQQRAIRAYRLDVPPGVYEVKLHFAELSGPSAESLPYNLQPAYPGPQVLRRVFDVRINDQPWLKGFDIGGFGLATPVVQTRQVSVESEEGIQIYFDAVEGEPVLNALQIKRIR